MPADASAAAGLDLSSGGFTIELWVNRGAAQAGTFFDMHEVPNVANQIVYVAVRSPSNRLRVLLRDGTNEVDVETSQTLASGSGWRHLAMVVDRGNAYGADKPRVHVFLDGVEASIATGNSDLSLLGDLQANSGNNTALVGAAATASGPVEIFVGNIDEFRVVKRALLPGEVAAAASSSLRE